MIFRIDRDLHYPEPSFEEIHRNRGVIQERTGLSATAVDELLDRIFKHIPLVPEADMIRYFQEAATATSPHPDADQHRKFHERDEDDVVILATALAIDGDIWSDDGVFEHQNHVTWFETSEVIEFCDVDL